MGKAGKLARSGQGFGVGRGENAGARVSRGRTRGRPNDLGEDARDGDFIPLNPQARRPSFAPADQGGSSTDQAAGIENAATALARPSKDPMETVRREGGKSPFIVEPRTLPEGHILPAQPSPFMEPHGETQTQLAPADGASDVVGVTIGNMPSLGVDTAQAGGKDAGAKGSLGRTTSFGP